MIGFWRILFFASLLYIGLVLILIKQDWVVETMTKERRAQIEFMGPEKAMAIHIRAENAFTKYIVNSGVMASSFGLNNSSDPTAADPGSKALNPVINFIDSRLRAFWAMVYQLYLRISYMLAWWPILAMAMIPTIIDALARRRAAQYTFAITSPHLQGIALRAIPTILLTYAIFLFAPFYIPPVLAPYIIVLTAALTWFAMAHFAKRW